MRKGIASSEKNSGIKLTIPCRTRTPLEAFQMLRQGQPIDIMAGYYEREGMIEKDFYMMDKLEKFHKIAELKQREAVAKQEIDAVQRQYNESLKQKQHDAEKAKADSKAATTPVQGGSTINPQTT